MGLGRGHGATTALPSPRPSHQRLRPPHGLGESRGAPEDSPRAPHSSPALLGYTWCFNKCFLFDFLIFVFSEKALASSNSFLRVAGRKQQQPGEGLTPKPFPWDFHVLPFTTDPHPPRVSAGCSPA